MKSPFPGMDPYIEACGMWENFHYLLIAQIQQHLARIAPNRYFVHAGERSYHVFVGTDEKSERPFVPDVKITTSDRGKKAKKKAGGVAVMETATDNEPLTLRAVVSEEHREGFVEIYEDSDSERRLVTTLEVLSPSNKAFNTEGWHQYHSKRYSALLEGVHLIEIDLLRGGQRPLMRDPWPDSPYTLLVGRANQRLRCQVWRAYFNRPLPSIPVPLATPDADLSLDLQPLIDTVYNLSNYGRAIDYRKPLKPPVSAEEQKWIEERLHEWRAKELP
jgi:hypothetical protein